MDASDLNLPSTGLAIIDVAQTPSLLIVRIASTNRSAVCPRCGRLSDRVHSRYTRTLADLPAHDRPVVFRLTVRRFRCTAPDCPRTIFCERLPGLVAPHARTTQRLTDIHRLIGLAVGGEAGSRLANHLDIPTSPDTVLRRVLQATEESAPPPRFIGIDDWAWCKGRRYGTIVVDLERGRVIDLLPDRNAETLKQWLSAHPGVELISRDRWTEYTRAATEAAPEARQVADRWHLLKNLREAIERLFERRWDQIAQALKPPQATWDAVPAPTAAAAPEKPPESPAPTPPHNRPTPSPRQQAQDAKRQRRVERFERVRQLHQQGRSIRGIVQDLGLSRKAVRRYLRRETCPDWGLGRPVPSKLDFFREWIDGQIAENRTNAAALHRELAARGCPVLYDAVRRYLTKRLAAAGKTRPRAGAAKAPSLLRPSPRRLSFDWVRRREARDEEQEARLTAIRSGSGELSTALELADEFTALVRKQSTGTLTAWLTRAESSECSELRRFAEGIRSDEAAVRAAVTEPWSNGPVEGQVNRLKFIKRQMYGRAGFALLRARVLHAA